MGMPCGFCRRCRFLSILWYQQKEMQFRIEIREHGAKPSHQERCLCVELSPWGKANGKTAAWGELHPGTHSHSQGIGGSATVETSASRTPHPTAKELLT